MALTNKNFYLTTILVILIVFSGLAIVGTKFVNNPRLNIDEESVDYLLEIKGLNSQNGYDSISNTSSAETQQSNILDSGEDNQVSDTNDFLSTLYIKKERASQPTNFFKLIYNAPSSILTGLGLDIGDWKTYINIFSYAVFVGLLLLIWLFIG